MKTAEQFSTAERIAYGDLTPIAGEPKCLASRRGKVFKEFLTAAATGILSSPAGAGKTPEQIAARAATVADALMTEYVDRIEAEFVRYSNDPKLCHFMGYGENR